MKLSTQKKLAADIMGVGVGKVWFDPLRLDEIQQAITREDVKGLIKERTISQKVAFRRRRNKPKKAKRAQSRRRRPSGTKREYMNKIRKMRKHLEAVYAKGEISIESRYKLRGLAKAGQFRTLKHLQESMKVKVHK